MTDEEFDTFVAESVEALEGKQERLQEEFGLGSHAEYLFDQATVNPGVQGLLWGSPGEGRGRSDWQLLGTQRDLPMGLGE